ncbi:hypothetical protein [Kordiimonas pumila]|uniref:Tetratricopeptide repeat protein n=1 Tax=Kordiimonas pumila TaxID=2161677 RepID=A0ABV7D945_9PROT|nr:hypothetical protein [Kordiimonas pumila]
MFNVRSSVSAIVIAAALSSVPLMADDSLEYYHLQNDPVVSPADQSREQFLFDHIANLSARLSQKDLSKDEKVSLKSELKVAKLEYKSLSKANKKALKQRRKSLAALQKKLEKEYGLGPYPYEIERFLADKPQALIPFYRSLYIEGERNAALNFDRLGLAAMEVGLYDHAAWALDRSIDRIESIYANNPEAKAAKSKFKAEKIKDFKGEPYERAMAYYYRGLLYLREGDFENARAVFRAGEYQDTVADEEEFQADFAVLNYLDGWSLHCQGRDAAESFQRAADVNSQLLLPEDSHNTLFIAELRAGPIKYGEGEYNEILKFKPDERYGETSATYVITNRTGAQKSIPVVLASDLYWQSSTRGGRPIDGILEGKAQFKKTTDTVGDVATTVGAATALAGIYSGDSDAALAGAGIMLIGGIFKGIANASKPDADIRMWDTLPQDILVGSEALHYMPDAKVETIYSGQNGMDIANSASAIMIGGTPECGVVWSRSRSALSVPESSPGARYSWSQIRKQKKTIQEKDVAFRGWLANEAPSVIQKAGL